MNGCRGILVACLCLATVPGCQLLHSYRPVPILVRDAETKQPIAGAMRHISYPLLSAPQAPEESRAQTAADGIARLQAAPAGPGGVLLTVCAGEYLTEPQTLSVESVRALKPAGWFEKVEQRPPQLTVELYAGPRPTVELVLPAGFRGLVTATVKPATVRRPHRGSARSASPSRRMATSSSPVRRFSAGSRRRISRPCLPTVSAWCALAAARRLVSGQSSPISIPSRSWPARARSTRRCGGPNSGPAAHRIPPAAAAAAAGTGARWWVAVILRETCPDTGAGSRNAIRTP